MATIAEQLTSLANTKTAIKDAIVAKGVAVANTDPFSTYPAKIGQISGGGGATTKYGVSIDNLLGNVDAEGILRAPQDPFVFDGTGIKNIYFATIEGIFGSNNQAVPNPVTKILLPDLEAVSGTVSQLAKNAAKLTEVDISKLRTISGVGLSMWEEAFMGCVSLSVLRADNLTEISANIACNKMFSGCSSLKSACLPNLTTISGSGACQYMYQDCIFEELGLDNLATISGTSACQYMFQGLTIDDAEFPKLATITGATACRYWFRNSTVKRVYFPALTTVVADAFGTTTSNGAFNGCSQLLEIHFRADAQAVIEGLTAYQYKFGATNAMIYFDL